METQNQPAKKKEYKTLKEAFRVLPESVQEHCVRVAEYTKVLFTEAIAVDFRVGDDKASAQLSFDNEQTAYLAGLYHDIGKLNLAKEYQSFSPSFDEVEAALYRKHTSDGVQIFERLSDSETWDKTQKDMIAKAIMFHHQNPEGGFPECRSWNQVGVMPMLVGFADRLDHAVTKIRSENPFEKVFSEFLNSFPEDSEFHLLLTESRHKLFRVFIKYENQSLKYPTVLPFVKRKLGRPFELKYRPIVDRRNRKTVALQAQMWFKDARDVFVDYEEVKPIINANKLVPDLGRYYLYEAGDTFKRFEACEVPLQYIAVELMPTFFTQTKAVASILTQIQDSRMEKGQLVFVMSENMFENPSKSLMNVVERLTKEQIPLMLVDYSGRFLKPTEVSEYSFKYIMLSSEIYPTLESEATAAMLSLLRGKGIELIAGELDKTKFNGALNRAEVFCMTGRLAGEYITENEAVQSELSVNQQ